MLMYMLNIKIKPKEYDSTDGLAVAVCHALQNDILNKKAKKPIGQILLKITQIELINLLRNFLR